MAKTLQNLIATAIITGTLCSPAYSGERLNRKYGNVGQNTAEAVVESAGDAMGKGLEKGLGGLKSFSQVANLFSSSNSYENKEKQIELKRKVESYAFRYILDNINKNTSKEASLLKSIIEDSEKYHNSLNSEELKRFNNFWKKIEEKNIRPILVYANKDAFAWRLMENEIDLAEMHILYQLETNYSSMNKTKNHQSFKSLLKPKGIEQYISSKIK